MKLPVVSGKDVVRALSKAGFMPLRQKGSHVILAKNGIKITVPLHRELKKGTLRHILRTADISPEEFIELLK